RNPLSKCRQPHETARSAPSVSLRGISLYVESPSRRSAAACRAGEPEVILSLPAQVMARAHGLAPGLMAEAFALAARVLPRAGGIGTRAARGWESESAAAPSLLTRLGDEAARRNNQFPGPRHPSASRSP